MNPVLAELSVPRPDRHLHLLQYAPRSGGQPRVFGAVWMDQQRLRWASPLVHWLDGVFNPQPFMVRFQDAIHEVALFEEAIVWLDAVCYAAAGPSEVQQACLGPLDWGLSCFEYSELSRTGTDLAGLLGEHPDPAILSPELQTACVIASLEHLVKGHRLFASTALELVHGQPFECARLHLPGNRCIRVSIDPQAEPRDAVARAKLEHDRLLDRAGSQDRSLLVLPRLRAPTPTASTDRVTVTGLSFDAMVAGLLQLMAR